MNLKRLLKPLITAILALLTLATIFHQYKNELSEPKIDQIDPEFDRIEHLKNVCTKYRNPFRTEYSALHAQAVTRIGAEVVHMRSKSTVKPMISLCMPHKVGSHAWGQFSQELKIHPSQQHLSWQVKAGLSIKAVIVRHPLERLLSVYRMIFEDWCDQKRFFWARMLHMFKRSERSALYKASGASLVNRSNQFSSSTAVQRR